MIHRYIIAGVRACLQKFARCGGILLSDIRYGTIVKINVCKEALLFVDLNVVVFYFLFLTFNRMSFRRW